MASEYVKSVTASEFDAELKTENQIVLVDFWAQWCGPCKAIAPLLDDVATELGGKLKVLKVDVDKEGALAAKYGIQSIPTLFFFKNGEQKEAHVGSLSKKSLMDKLAALA